MYNMLYLSTQKNHPKVGLYSNMFVSSQILAFYFLLLCTVISAAYLAVDSCF